jgi:hypothetical protein
MNKRFFISCAAALVCASCGSGPWSAIERSSDDPKVVAPTVVSFVRENRIGVSWPADPCAEEYVLEEASGSIGDPPYSVAYRGTSNHFEDTDCVDQSLHLYRLTKMRGSEAFGPSEVAMGVGSAVTRDAEEPNDEEAEATDLGYEKSANLYLYRSYKGIEIEDGDWYSIGVPPRMIAYVVVAQTNPAISGQEATWMSLYRPGQIPTPVANDAPIPLANYAYSTQRIAFAIFPRAENFFGASGSAGGSTINYVVKLYSIEAL